MEMRAIEEIEMGEDITPPLPPLTFALHDSFLHSHCSSCFSPLPNNPKSHHRILSPSFLYCSPVCSSHSHSSTSQLHLLLRGHSSSTDLRAALRLLLSLPSSSASLHHARISGLLTNRDLLMQDHETAARVRDGAEAISAAFLTSVRHQNEIAPSSSSLLTLSEAVLCLVITNAVEVQDKDGRILGIAVYGSQFSWINHSCSPNACYRFYISPSPSMLPCSARPSLRIAANNDRLGNELTGGCIAGGDECGPRVVVRSIKRIKKGEEVTVTYTDLLQPKATRQSELWSKYCFGCCCARCDTIPSSYIDCSLEEIFASNLSSSSLDTNDNFNRDETNERLIDYVDEVITKYLSVGDPESCCEKLENMLTFGILDGQLETKERKMILNFRLHPFHHLALKAYTTLASAYKIRGIELLTLHSEVDGPQLESFKMIRTSAAYSFFLAAATNYLSCFESSLIVNVANLWTDAGEALLTLARSLAWGSLGNSIASLPSPAQCKCPRCSLLDFDANMFPHLGQNEDFGNISCKFLDCIKRFLQDVWPFLIEGCHYLTMFKDLNVFSWLGKSSTEWDFEAYLVGNHMSSTNCSLDRIRGYEVHEDTNQRRITIFQLGVHCLCYGGILASISYGPNSRLTSHVKDILYVQK